MSDRTIVKVKAAAAFLIMILAGVNMIFGAPKIGVEIYWVLVYGYWVFCFVTEVEKAGKRHQSREGTPAGGTTSSVFARKRANPPSPAGEGFWGTEAQDGEQ